VNGNPIVVHLHGGHSNASYDGFTEAFYSPKNETGFQVQGPFFTGQDYFYESQPAAAIWYHDHTLGTTRLNVYAGMAGFYIIRDKVDTGTSSNAYNLPIFPYELALAVQDRFFKNTGELFYPAFPGDPWYEVYLGTDPNIPPAANFTDRPSVLTEFFGDHMVVNGKVWPKKDVELRSYRLRLLNGCDSRFLVIEFYLVAGNETDWKSSKMGPLNFTVIGKDQGLFPKAQQNIRTLVVETGSRYDIIIDFSSFAVGDRIIMANRGGDLPFNGFPPANRQQEPHHIPDFTPLAPFDGRYIYTDRIMAFDLKTRPKNAKPVNYVKFDAAKNNPISTANETRVRKVALFEGSDEYGRLQPQLGTAQLATNYNGMPIYWPSDCPDGPYCKAGLSGLQMEGSVGWHSPTTENPALNATEIWEIWNVSPDAHPVHLHLVHFEVVGRHDIIYNSAIDPDNACVPDDTVSGNFIAPTDGICLVPQKVVQFDGSLGDGFKIVFPANCTGFEGNCYNATAAIIRPDAYVDGTRMDMVAALPGQVTRIKATFDKPGLFVWHCHILSHEDHEMMRVLFVGPGAHNEHDHAHGTQEYNSKWYDTEI
jgi:FtsP/CotA-like multicopper oxidase with cupredoxin domain